MTRTALITGGAGGIGLAVAGKLAADGARVVVADKTPADEAVADIGAIAHTVDLSAQEACDQLVADVVSELGSIDILVNNAGFQHLAPLEEFDPNTWGEMLAVMLTAPFLLTRAAFPHMKKSGWGRIINVGSIHSLVASPLKAGYVSAKHGLVGLTRTTALEGGPHGITANVICPAYVRTALVEDQIDAQAASHGLSTDEVVQQIMLEPAAIKRLIEPEEVAAVVSFLCSEDGGSVTGATWTMDVGWTAR